MFEQKLIFLDPISTDDIPPPYDETVRVLQELEIEVDKSLDPDLMHFLVWHCLDARNTMMHWVKKLKWHSKHKVPGKQAYVRAIKPWGEIGYHLLELCIQVHAGVGYKAAGYPDAAIWFEEVWADCIKADIAYLIRLARQAEDNKAIRIGGIRQEASSLKNDQNPYDPALQPHLHHLIKCSLKLAGRAKGSDQFRKNYWNPFIRALTACATQMDSNKNGFYQIPLVREEQRDGKIFRCVYRPIGRGKGLELIYAKEVVPETPAP